MCLRLDFSDTTIELVTLHEEYFYARGGWRVFMKLRLYTRFRVTIIGFIPDNKVHGASMGPTWVQSAPDGPHIGPMNIAIRDVIPEREGLIIHFDIRFMTAGLELSSSWCP